MSEVGKALRWLYDRFGCQVVLAQPAYLLNGLGDLVEDAKKTRNLFRLALDAGMGRLYLEQLQQADKPDEAFYLRVAKLLIQDGGLGKDPALQLIRWFDEMVGWAPAQTQPQKHDKRAGNKVIGIDLGDPNARAAVMEGDKVVLVPQSKGGDRSGGSGVQNGWIFLRHADQTQAAVLPGLTVCAALRAQGTSNGVLIEDGPCSPQLMAALLLRKARRDAEEYLGETVTRAVVAVPNSYTSIQRQAVFEAGRIAGLRVERLINVSSAAVLTQGYSSEKTEKRLVCSMSCGSFDAAVVEVGDGIVEVQAAAGDCALGSDDFEEAVVRWMSSEFQRAEGIDLRRDAVAVARMKDAAKWARQNLAGAPTTQVYLPYIASGPEGYLHLQLTLSADQLRQWTAPLVNRMTALVRRILKDAELKGAELDRVLLAGDAGGIPAFREAIAGLTGKKPAVVGQDDACVAMGAGIYGGILTGDVKNLTLLDVVAQSLGIETAGGVFTQLIPRNTTIATFKKQQFSTMSDNQVAVDIHVLQGESDKAAENTSLGRFQLTGIKPAKAGVPRIEVEFDIDWNGMLSITAKDLETGNERPVRIVGDASLSETQLQEDARRAEALIPID